MVSKQISTGICKGSGGFERDVGSSYVKMINMYRVWI
jgi:hypothetical protein